MSLHVKNINHAAQLLLVFGGILGSSVTLCKPSGQITQAVAYLARLVEPRWEYGMLPDEPVKRAEPIASRCQPDNLFHWQELLWEEFPFLCLHFFQVPISLLPMPLVVKSSFNLALLPSILPCSLLFHEGVSFEEFPFSHHYQGSIDFNTE